MFQIVCDPSSGGIELYLTEIRSGSLMFVVCLVGVWQCNFEPVVCMYGTTVSVIRPTYRTHTHAHARTHTHTRVCFVPRNMPRNTHYTFLLFTDEFDGIYLVCEM